MTKKATTEQQETLETLANEKKLFVETYESWRNKSRNAPKTVDPLKCVHGIYYIILTYNNSIKLITYH